MTITSTVIRLNDIRLYGHHGITEDERQVGSHFVINLALTVNVGTGDLAHDTLEKSVNYADAYAVLKKEFMKPSATLEHLAHRILTALLHDFTLLQGAEIEIHKLNPPFCADCASASVTLCIQR